MFIARYLHFFNKGSLEENSPFLETNDKEITDKKITFIKKKNDSDSFSYYYKIGDKKHSFDETTKKSIHHNYVINKIKNTKKSSFLDKAIILTTIIGIAAFVSLFFYIHSYLFLIGAVISFIALVAIITTNLLLYKNTKNNQAIIDNLSRKKDDPNRKRALIFLPLPFADENKIFTNNYKKILEPLENRYNLDVFFPVSIQQINFLLKHKKYAHLLFCGHGKPTAMKFTPSFTLKKDNVSSSLKDGLSNLNAKAIIALNSCSTGAKDGIAEEIAKISQRTVFAPQENSTDFKIDYSKKGFPEYSFYKKLQNKYNVKIQRKIKPSKSIN